MPDRWTRDQIDRGLTAAWDVSGWDGDRWARGRTWMRAVLGAVGARPPPKGARRRAPRDRVRLHTQACTILDRLRRGPATTEVLAAIARKYTGRVSELRDAGHVVRCERAGRGRYVYTLVDDRMRTSASW